MTNKSLEICIDVLKCLTQRNVPFLLFFMQMTTQAKKAKDAGELTKFQKCVFPAKNNNNNNNNTKRCFVFLSTLLMHKVLF